MTDISPAPPFIRIGPDRPESPVVLSVPHAGRDYSPELLAAARLHRSVLEALEDRYMDRLIWRAVEAGATAIVARSPRAEIDLNRDEREIDPGLIVPPLPAAQVIGSVRTRGGLGLIPSRINGSGAIWRARIPTEEFKRRVEEIHRPYHGAVSAALKAARARFGAAILLDCHSMPPRPAEAGRPSARIVFGDRHGASCNARFMEAALLTARRFGYHAAANVPYAGGHVVARHGRPERQIHALQVEYCRTTYLDIGLSEPGPGFAAAAALLAELVAVLERQLLGPDWAIAAE